MKTSAIPKRTKMLAEIEEIPVAIQRLLDNSQASIIDAAQDLRRIDPHVITTVARGSSDHAAAYLKYAIELLARVPVASTGPSISSIFGVTLKLDTSANISISQSGKSPDIIQMAEAAGRGGALTIAITNNTNSPIAKVCAHAIDIQAGVEKSVAATKTFVTSIAAGLLLLAHWQGDESLLAAMSRLPEHTAAAAKHYWSPLCERLAAETSLFILGRGPSIAIAKEAALKFKETCQIHAEAYSAAEVLHGPVSLVGSHFPVLALAGRDASERSICATADLLARHGADVFTTSDKVGKSIALPFTETGHPLTDPLVLVISFYAFIERLARLRGLNPDTPPNLKKVTETV